MNMVLTIANNWSIDNLLKNTETFTKNSGGAVIVIIGIALIVCMAVIGGIKLISGGCQKWAWPVIIIGIFIGGAFMAGGFDLLSTIAAGGKTTLEEFGRSSVN